MARQQKTRRGLIYVCYASAKNTKGNDSNDQGKTKQSKTYGEIMQDENTKRNSRLNRPVWTVFLLTAPIEEVARWQYKTVLIIFPFNLQTIIIASDVVKGRIWDFNRNIHHTCIQVHLPLITHRLNQVKLNTWKECTLSCSINANSERNSKTPLFLDF